ncbi:MAG: ABC transporter ATP-binding protein [Lawsonibacter sp.]|nr:ABC transporter ATP-binding protein [Lawsonibacter sp.]
MKGNPAPLVDIRDLVVEFKTERSLVHALNGVNLQIKQGESLGLVGEAGAGKTTTALGILNLMSPQAAKVKDGDIRYSGKSVFQMSNRELLEMRGGKVSMIFQNPLTSLNPVFTVGEQIAVLLRKHMKMNRRQAMIEASKLLEMVGISGTRVNDYPHQFSGGMRQRVGIAAALACRPELLIADEPTTALDVTIQAQILELMKELQEKYSTSLLMITHNLGIISELCQRVAVMYAGRIIESGTVAQVFARPAHPYTMGLLNALPKLTGPRERLTAIPGRVADPQNLPQGCSFHPRCANCTEQCKQKTPAMTQITSEHSVACFNPMS